MHKGQTVQLCIFMLYQPGASPQTKAVMAAINCSSGQLQQVNQMSLVSVNFFPLIIELCCCLFLSRAVYLTSQCGCLLPFPNSRRSPCLASSGTFLPIGKFHKVDFLCFHCPSYQFLFCPSPGCSRYSLMCSRNAAPGGIPPSPPPACS